MTTPHMPLTSRIVAACFLLLTTASPSRMWAQDVLTQRNNNLRTGVSSWPGLDQTTVKDFQLLASLPVDGPVLAQPLVVLSQMIRGEQHSVLWIATAANTIYAFNADPPFQQLCNPLNLGEPYVPPNPPVGLAQQVPYFNPRLKNNSQQQWIIGIEATPVIDLTTHRMFVSYRRSKGKVGEARLAAIDITTCKPKDDIKIPGGDDWHRLHRNRASLLLDNHIVYVAFAGIIEFHPGKHDGYDKSWQGWIHAFDAGTLLHLGAYRTLNDPTNFGDPLNDRYDGGGIWQGSTGLAADSKGNIFFATGNASQNSAPPDAGNLAGSVVRLSVARVNPKRLVMHAADWFTPYSKIWQDQKDIDLGSGGVVLIPGTHYMVSAGKEGILYLLDRNNMGKFDDRRTVVCPDLEKPVNSRQSLAVPDDPKRDHAVQKFQVGTNRYMKIRPCGNDFGPDFDHTQWPHIHGTPVFGELGPGRAFLYIWPEKDRLKSFRWLGDKFDKQPAIALGLPEKPGLPGKPAMTPPWKNNFIGQVGMPGAMLSLTVDPNKPDAGVLFASLKTCSDGNGWRECSPEACGTPNMPVCVHQDDGLLRAFDPISLREVWNNQVSTNASAADKKYGFAKFVPPTLTKGRAYLATVSYDKNPQVVNKVLVYGSLGGVIWRSTGIPCFGNSCPGWTRLDDDDFAMGLAAAGNNLYKLAYDGRISHYVGGPCDAHGLCPGWQPLDQNWKAVAIAAGGNQLYQMHNDGAIFQYTGRPCKGASCPGWLPLDNNPKAVAIAASNTTLYQLHNDGAIVQYTGRPCNGNSCPGWLLLDLNFNTVAIAAGDNALYQLHRDGSIFQYTGTACSGNSCPGWIRLDNNSKTVAIVAGGGLLAGQLYQMHNDGAIFRYNGNSCNGESCPGWEALDKNSATVAIAASANSLYQLHSDGAIFRHVGGAVCKGNSCPGWQRLDNNTRSGMIAAGGAQLYQLHADPVYQLHKDGSIWRNIGLGWYKLDANPASVAISAAGKELFQLHKDGSIWRFTGIPCGTAACPGWEKLDNNPATTAIVAAGKEFFQLHKSGSIWRYLGTPCTNSSCPGWEKLDNNPATVSIVAAGTQMFQLHKSGSIWRYVGTPCNDTSCPGWEKLDNSAATKSIVASGSQLFQTHKSGSIWRYTGTPCNDSSCPGWEELDRSPATASVVASGKELFQMRNDGSILRYIGRPCSLRACSGWQIVDHNHASAEISAGGKELYQRHTDGSVWHYLGAACTSVSSCPGWQQIDNNRNAIHIQAGNLQ
jgi:hypothetical protein